MVMKLSAQPKPSAFTIGAGEFKAKCLRLMDEALATQEPFTVTKRGKVIGSFVPEPTEEKPFHSFIGSSPDIKILGDIISPLPQEWTLPEWAWDKSRKHSKKEKKRK
jgi:hypothetical protein